jgi:mitotic spindle assembly checkpoint protein MAD2
LSIEWLTKKTIQKLVIVIKSIETQEVLERWQFDVDCDKELLNKYKSDSEIPTSKSDDVVKKEIRDVMR